MENDSPVSILAVWTVVPASEGQLWNLVGPRDGYVASGRSERTLRQLEVGKHGTENWISFHTGEFLTSHTKDSLGLRQV